MRHRYHRDANVQATLRTLTAGCAAAATRRANCWPNVTVPPYCTANPSLGGAAMATLSWRLAPGLALLLGSAIVGCAANDDRNDRDEQTTERRSSALTTSL